MSYSYEQRLEQSKKKLKEAQKTEIQMSFTVMTMGDERVCPECQKHEDIKVDDVYDAVIGVNHPPFHEECRCIATYSIEKIRTPEEQRAVMSQLNNNSQTKKEPQRKVELHKIGQSRKKSLGMRLMEKLKKD